MIGEAERFDDVAAAFADVSRTLTAAVEQARDQAEHVARRAEEQATGWLNSANARIAEADRKVAEAEERVAVAEARLTALLGRIEHAQSRLAGIADLAQEIVRVAGASEHETSAATLDAGQPELFLESHTPLAEAGHSAQPAALDDPLQALASLRLALDNAAR